MYRLLFIGSSLLWAGAMTALFVRDVWPGWTAQDAPPMTPAQLAKMDRAQEQFGIFRGEGEAQERLGSAWSRVVRVGEHVTMYGTVVVEGVRPIPPIRVETTTDFDEQGRLDSFELEVFGVPMTTIRVHGERHGPYLPCELQVGPLRRQANLDVSASRLIGESLRPFTFLPNLRVGQSWRMQILDPMSAVIQQQTQFNSVVATVTGTETIDGADGTPVECFVVKTRPQRTVAWVDREGRVLAQQVDVPGLGRITIRQEPFDEDAHEAAVQRVPSRRMSERNSKKLE